MSWEEARAKCQDLDADLASITSQETNTFLTSLISAPTWVGGYKDQNMFWSQQWKWSDGSDWSYENWNNGEPNNIGGTEDKITIRTNLFWGSWDAGYGKWNDDKSWKTYPFICQLNKQGITTTSTIYDEWPLQTTPLHLSDSWCKTSGGPAAGQPCVFPFTFQGVTHNTCTDWIFGEQPQGTRWCSTKTDSNGKHIGGKGFYGFCPDTCNYACRTKTDKKPCIFPFIYKSKTRLSVINVKLRILS